MTYLEGIFLFFCDLIVQPIRLLLRFWLENRIALIYKPFNRHPDWSRMRSCQHEQVDRPGAIIRPNFVGPYGLNIQSKV